MAVPKMFLVGLTGGIATGKSTVVKFLKNLGIEIIDADLIAREVVEPGKKAWTRIRTEFGDDVFHPDGTLNRPALGRIVFSVPEKRKTLNSITHPEIYKSIFFKCIRLFLTGHQFAVLDVPLLYESGKMVRFTSKVIVVSCQPAQQLDRLMQRDNISESDALSRINAQMKLEEKCKLADFVVDNSRDEAFTKAQVEAIAAQLKRLRLHWRFRLIALGSISILCSIVIFAIYGITTLF